MFCPLKVRITDSRLYRYCHCCCNPRGPGKMRLSECALPFLRSGRCEMSARYKGNDHQVIILISNPSHVTRFGRGMHGPGSRCFYERGNVFKKKKKTSYFLCETVKPEGGREGRASVSRSPFSIVRLIKAEHRKCSKPR